MNISLNQQQQQSQVATNNNESSETLLNGIISTLLLIAILIGLVGNVLNILVFSRPTMRKLSTFRFLLYMSVFDLLILITCATDAWATFNQYFSFQIRLVAEFTCRLHAFLTYFLSQCGTNILMLVNVDRAINLRSQVTVISEPRPRLLFNMCRIKHVDLVVFVLVILVTVVNAHFIFLLQLNHVIYDDNSSNDTSTGGKICYPIDNHIYHLFLQHVWTWIDFGLLELFPLVGMTVCSILIARALHTHSRRYSASMLLSSTSAQSRRLVEKRMQQTRQILLMLLVTTSYFLVTTLPYFILSIKYQSSEQEASPVVQLFVLFLLYSNSSIHFLFYGFSCEAYRKELVKLVMPKPPTVVAAPR